MAFNKAYLTDVNKRVHYVRNGQFTTDHDIQGTTVNWVGEEPRLAYCVCDNYQQAINTPAAPRFLLQPMQYSPVWPHGQSVL